MEWRWGLCVTGFERFEGRRDRWVVLPFDLINTRERRGDYPVALEVHLCLICCKSFVVALEVGPFNPSTASSTLAQNVPTLEMAGWGARVAGCPQPPRGGQSRDEGRAQKPSPAVAGPLPPFRVSCGCNGPHSCGC